MQKFKRIISWQLTVLVFMFFAISGALATPIKPIMAHIEGMESVKMGERTFIPVQIDRLDFKFKSGKVWFETGNNPVKIGEVALDLDKITSFPYIVYVPITVTGEGLFNLKGFLQTEALDEERVPGKNYIGKYPLHFGIFAFDGEVFFGGSSGRAIRNKAHHNLLKGSTEYNKLLNKKEKIESGVLRQSFPEEEEERLKQLRDDVTNQLLRKYYERYPLKIEPTSRLFNIVPSSKPQTGDNVALEVNWPIDESYTSFLPLDGAEITIYSNENNSTVQISKGTLDNGKYSFTSPKDNLSFTVKVTAKYGNDFEVHDGKDDIDNGIIEIGFSDINKFDITIINNNNSDLLKIEPFEANAWSVFQAFVELQKLSKNNLGFTKQSGYSIYVDADSSYYNGDIYLAGDDFFDWDVIAHEFSHAIAHETSSTISIGGSHSGGNQYDYPYNSGTYHDKENSLKLAFNEGYATWLGVALSKNSAYAGKVLNVGDDTYTDIIDGFNDIIHNLEANAKRNNAFGEDTEEAVMGILWDITDSSNEANTRAQCKTECKDSLSLSLPYVFSGALKGKNIASVSDFYRYLYYTQLSKYPSSAFDSLGVVNSADVTKTHQLGSIFAEFGIAPVINENDNNEKAFFGIYKQDFTPPTLVWKHLQTGNGALYLDRFEILFFNKDKSGLLYKIVLPDTLAPNANGEYRYTMSENEVNELRTVLKITYALGINVLIKGMASGENAEKGKIATGPYYSNLASFTINSNKLSVIAVDSSGSNTQTDPKNLRISAAHKMLKNMTDINKNLLEDTTNTDMRPILAAALDFDGGTRVIASFSEPEELYNRKVFNAIDSSGGTDIAGAINHAVNMITTDGSNNIIDLLYNRNTLYVLTDMDNNAGMAPVIAAIARAYANGVYVDIGHLVPLSINSQKAQSNVYEINGDPINYNDIRSSDNTLMKARTSFDDVIEAILMAGGSYMVIQDAASQEAWADLMAYLNTHDPENIQEIPLPLNIQYYGLARAGKSTPAFLITPKESGMIIVTVDSKGSFVPDIKYDGKGRQEDLGLNDYRIKFMAQAGKTYRVTVGDSLDDSGLYSIVANMEAFNPSLPKSSLITTGATIDENGDVYVWGFRGSGQQGNGRVSVSSSKSAAKVESLSNIVELTGGAYHLIALDDNKDVWGWGQSGYGESGCKHTTGIYVDTPCKVISNIAQIAAGEYFTIALDNEGNVYTWGHNLYGQLGNGNSKNSQTPVLVNLNGEKARLIGAAYEGAFAVTEEGHVYAWGDNEASGLGFKGTNYGVQKIVRTPVHVTNLDKYADDIIYIAGGNGWGEALLNDGTVIGWGLEAALGQGTTKTSLSSPEPVVILHNIKQLFARYAGSAALSDEGIIYTWGQTGGSAFKHIYGKYATPQTVEGEVIEIGGGKEHIFYKTADGSLYGVGYNDLYKLNLDRLGGIIQWNGEKIEYK